jgi:hypothetical protein
MATATHRGFVFWAPRVLTIAFIAFLSIFALDVFGGHHGFWRTLFALTMHLIPNFVLIGILVLAWRREWIGAVLFAVLAAGYVLGPLQPWPVRHQPLPARLMTDLIIAGPGFVIAALFLLGWLRRRRDAAAPRRT